MGLRNNEYKPSRDGEDDAGAGMSQENWLVKAILREHAKKSPNLVLISGCRSKCGTKKRR